MDENTLCEWCRLKKLGTTFCILAPLATMEQLDLALRDFQLAYLNCHCTSDAEQHQASILLRLVNKVYLAYETERLEQNNWPLQCQHAHDYVPHGQESDAVVQAHAVERMESHGPPRSRRSRMFRSDS